MLDILGAIFATAVYAAIVGVLVCTPRARQRTKLLALATAAIWGGLVTTVAASGGLAPGTIGPVPATLLPFVFFLASLVGGWYLLPRFRSALLSIPLPALIGLNAARLGGVFFLMLAADDRLSAPFAPIAGLGDMLVATLAIPLATVAARDGFTNPTWFRLWNVFGALDLVVAISLGILSAPGTPLRVFTDGAGTEAMTTLPWAFVPAMIVPLFLLIHLTIAAKIGSAHDTSARATLAPEGQWMRSST
jgi:hypothetical protein